MIEVLALVVDEHKIIRALERLSYLKITYLIVGRETNFPESVPDLVITVSDWRHDIARLLFEAKDLRVPSLMLQDGTLDWILQFEGDRYGGKGGPTHFQPILTDKIACIGPGSARMISSFSGIDSVEVTGFPKMHDEVLDAVQFNKVEVSVRPNVGVKKILITSPRQGWFSEDHREAFGRALKDLKDYTDSRKDIVCIWRLSRNLASIVGVENVMKHKESYELVDLIKDSDAVISAQSTVVLEAMLYNKPVAIMDYLVSPQFYGVSWMISHKEHIKSCIEGILKPSPEKMAYQNYQLNDNLLMSANPIEKCGELITAMVEHARELKRERGIHTDELSFPTNMLKFNEPFPQFEIEDNLKYLYPEVEAFRIDDVLKLQLLYNRLMHESKLDKNSGFLSKIKRLVRRLCAVIGKRLIRN